MLVVRVVEVIVRHATGDEPTDVLRQRFAKVGINHWLGHITGLCETMCRKIRNVELANVTDGLLDGKSLHVTGQGEFIGSARVPKSQSWQF